MAVSEAAPLTLPPETLRAVGHRAVDAIAERLAGLEAAPVGSRATRAELEARLREPLPEHGEDPQAVLDAVLRDVLAPGLNVDHPRFFAFVPMPANPLGAIADALAAGFGVFSGTWLGSPGRGDRRARRARLAARAVRPAGRRPKGCS